MEQNENRFFKYLWRFNALVIAGAAVLCILIGSFAAIMIFKEETGVRHVTNVVNIGGRPQVKEEFILGYPDVMTGTDYIKIPLYRDQHYEMSSYSKKSGGNEVNYLFVSASSNEGRWLLETTDQLFISETILSERLKNLPAEEAKVLGVVYSLVEKDSDGDGRLTNRDLITVSASDAGGRSYRELIEGIERLYAIRQIADDKFLVLYQANKETISGLYSVPSMTQISQQKIPQVRLE